MLISLQMLAEVLKMLLENIAGSLHKTYILPLAKIEPAQTYCHNLIKPLVNNI